eukprot:c16497_g1_i1.p1 GENE.c16497_g1_i1~~c16497_g1_i1.p1  ORF type:complete len:312 (-),score=58.96 c16497_g1_i1:30-929(-)
MDDQDQRESKFFLSQAEMSEVRKRREEIARRAREERREQLIKRLASTGKIKREDLERFRSNTTDVIDEYIQSARGEVDRNFWRDVRDQLNEGNTEFELSRSVKARSRNHGDDLSSQGDAVPFEDQPNGAVWENSHESQTPNQDEPEVLEPPEEDADDPPNAEHNLQPELEQQDSADASAHSDEQTLEHTSELTELTAELTIEHPPELTHIVPTSTLPAEPATEPLDAATLSMQTPRARFANVIGMSDQQIATLLTTNPHELLPQNQHALRAVIEYRKSIERQKNKKWMGVSISRCVRED